MGKCGSGPRGAYIPTVRENCNRRFKFLPACAGATAEGWRPLPSSPTPIGDPPGEGGNRTTQPLDSGLRRSDDRKTATFLSPRAAFAMALKALGMAPT